MLFHVGCVWCSACSQRRPAEREQDRLGRHVDPAAVVLQEDLDPDAAVLGHRCRCSWSPSWAWTPLLPVSVSELGSTSTPLPASSRRTWTPLLPVSVSELDGTSTPLPVASAGGDLVYTENEPGTLRCVAIGGYPPADIAVYVGRRDVTAQLAHAHSASPVPSQEIGAEESLGNDLFSVECNVETQSINPSIVRTRPRSREVAQGCAASSTRPSGGPTRWPPAPRTTGRRRVAWQPLPGYRPTRRSPASSSTVRFYIVGLLFQ